MKKPSRKMFQSELTDRIDLIRYRKLRSKSLTEADFDYWEKRIETLTEELANSKKLNFQSTLFPTRNRTYINPLGESS